MEIEGVLIIISVVVFVAVVYVIAEEFQRIAQMKGHNEKRYFWWSFLLGVVGWTMVIALPDRAKEPKLPKWPPA